MNIHKLIKENRGLIDSVIKKKYPEGNLDDNERELWIMNDESLYRWAKSKGVKI